MAEAKSDLERAVLAALGDSPAAGTAELVDRVSAPRPSVSRAVHRLADKGLVKRVRGEWHVTAEGSARANAASGEIAARTGREIQGGVDAIGRALERQKRFESIFGPKDMAVLVAGQNRLFEELRRIALGPLDSISSSVARAMVAPALPTVPTFMLPGASVVLSMQTELMGFAPMASALETLRLSQMEFVKSLVGTMPDYSRTIQANASMISGIVSDLSVMPSLAGSFGESPAAAALLRSVTWSGDALRQHVAGTIQGALRIAETGAPATPRLTDRVLVGPTTTTGLFIRTVRTSLQEPATQPAIEVDGSETSRGSLGVRLRQLAPRLEEIHAAAWRAALSDTPGDARSSAHLGRELIAQVLEELAPDSAFTPAELGSATRATRAMRVRRVVARHTESGATWAVALAEGVTSTYDVLSAEAHSRKERPRFDREQRVGILMTVEGLLRVILSFSERGSG